MKKFILIIICFSLIGCTTVYGTKNLDNETIALIVKGETTKEEVLELLGKPSSKITSNYEMPDVMGIDMSKIMPYETWTYTKVVANNSISGKNFIQYLGTGSGTVIEETKSLTVQFDKNGVVQSYASIDIN